MSGCSNWEDGSVGKMLAGKACVPEFRFREPLWEKLAVLVCTYNPSSVEVERILWAWASQSSWADKCQVMRHLVAKNKKESSQERHQTSTSGFHRHLHIHTCICNCTHSCVYTCAHTQILTKRGIYWSKNLKDVIVLYCKDPIHIRMW